MFALSCLITPYVRLLCAVWEFGKQKFNHLQKQNMSTNVEGQVSAQIDTKQMLAEVPVGLNALANIIFHRNLEKWNYPVERNIGEILCLMHSEISEALEADRKDRYATSNMNVVNGWTSDEDFKKAYKEKVKGTFEEEMADIFIRLLDVCGYKSVDIVAHVKAKLRYTFMNNETFGKKY